jgi:BRO family, N-terminal domain
VLSPVFGDELKISTMSDLIVFGFENQQVRFVGTPEYPEWVAQDVGIALDIQNIRQLLTKFDDDEKGVCTIYTPGGAQEMLTVKEPGLYRLIFKSRSRRSQAISELALSRGSSFYTTHGKLLYQSKPTAPKGSHRGKGYP